MQEHPRTDSRQTRQAVTSTATAGAGERHGVGYPTTYARKPYAIERESERAGARESHARINGDCRPVPPHAGGNSSLYIYRLYLQVGRH